MAPEVRDATMEWVDVRGKRWGVELPSQRIVLRCEAETIEISAAQWRRDLYIAAHGSGFIVRVERFDSPLGFLLTRGQTEPLLAHLGVVEAAPGEEAQPESKTPAAPLLWPKVSPLAVWALICSALAFIPLVGLLPGMATVALLVVHRKRVRRSAAYAHSRALCRVAFVFLVAGSAVSALATAGVMGYGGAASGSSLFGETVGKGHDARMAVLAVVVVLLSLSVHEAAHAITAWWLGDGLARSLGRVTLNPLAHIDPFGTILLPAVLAWAGAPMFGYARPVPVNVANVPRWRRAHILISLAGPGSNLLLASASLLLLLAIGCGARFFVDDAAITQFVNRDVTAPLSATGFVLAWVVGPLCNLLHLSFIVNVALALFNLVPIPPLDGSWVLEHLFPNSMGRIYAVVRPYGFVVFIAAFYAGMFEYLGVPLSIVVFAARSLLAAATGM